MTAVDASSASGRVSSVDRPLGNRRFRLARRLLTVSGVVVAGWLLGGAVAGAEEISEADQALPPVTSPDPATGVDLGAPVEAITEPVTDVLLISTGPAEQADQIVADTVTAVRDVAPPLADLPIPDLTEVLRPEADQPEAVRPSAPPPPRGPTQPVAVPASADEPTPEPVQVSWQSPTRPEPPVTTTARHDAATPPAGPAAPLPVPQSSGPPAGEAGVSAPTTALAALPTGPSGTADLPPGVRVPDQVHAPSGRLGDEPTTSPD